MFRNFRVIAIALAAAVMLGCESSTGPGDFQPANLADVLNEAVDGRYAAIAGTRTQPAPGVPSVPPDCSYDGASQSFLCPRITSGSLTVDRSFILYDAAGSRQSLFGETTASVLVKSMVAGTSAVEGSTTTIDVVDDRTVSGLLSSRHVLNGTTTTKANGTFAFDGGAPLATASTDVMKIEELVLPSARGGWPGPGTTTSDITSSFGDFPASSARIRSVFNGTKCVTVTITSAGFTDSFTIDMSSPGATSCTP
jgi:hypothetical protein